MIFYPKRDCKICEGTGIVVLKPHGKRSQYHYKYCQCLTNHLRNRTLKSAYSVTKDGDRVYVVETDENIQQNGE